ncbi:MAG: methyl-accepting chemotaxis protein [Spirochaetota bacterium]|nr:methyl-accepting chemotaxis protein [Spirochaetota bacterium]
MAKNVKEKLKSKPEQGIKKISETSQANQNSNSTITAENSKLNTFAIITTWITMVLGEVIFLVSQFAQQRQFDDFKMQLIIFTVGFSVLNLIPTIIFFFFKRIHSVLKYIIPLTFSSIVPLYSYVCLGYNHQVWMLGLCVIIFSILFMSKRVFVITTVFLTVMDFAFLFIVSNMEFNGEKYIDTLFNMRAEIGIRLACYVIALLFGLRVINYIRVLFNTASANEKRTNEQNKKMEEIVFGIKDLSEKLKKLSTANADYAEKLSESSESQASGIEEIASSTEELMSSIEEIAKNTTLVYGEIERVTIDSEKGTTSLNSSSSEMHDLVLFSQKMIESIDAINEIAENTNLLALNAAIEAARAGDAGKGFAVVATEIRKLAEKSTRAASEVGDLLRESKIKINKTSDLNKAVAETYNDVSAKLDEITKVFQQISFATQELDKGGREIAKALEGISQTSNENFDMSKEIESTTKEVDSEIRHLTQLIGN